MLLGSSHCDLRWTGHSENLAIRAISIAAINWSKVAFWMIKLCTTINAIVPAGSGRVMH